MFKALSLSVALAIFTVAMLALIPQSWMSESHAPADTGSQVQDPSPQTLDMPANDNAIIIGTFVLHPQVLNLNGGAKFVTGALSLPEGYSVGDVYAPSVMLNGAVYADTSFWMHNTVVDIQDRAKLMLKFDREEVKEILLPGESVQIVVTGNLYDGTTFTACDYISVVG